MMDTTYITEVFGESILIFLISFKEIFIYSCAGSLQRTGSSLLLMDFSLVEASSLVAVHGLLIVLASSVAEHRP